MAFSADVDFSLFGENRTITISKVALKLTAAIARIGQFVPHVTQFNEADITELENSARMNQEDEKKGS